MWKPEHRAAADRRGLRYPSDLTDGEWALVEPLIPPAKQGGRKRSVDLREVLNGIFYVLSTGCQWKALPKDLPPKEYGLRLSRPVGLGRDIGAHPSRALRRAARARRARGEPERRDHRQPERQSGAKRGASIDPQGYDAGKSAPRRRASSMEEGSIRRVVD
jgi:transposase